MFTFFLFNCKPMKQPEKLLSVVKKYDLKLNRGLFCTYSLDRATKGSMADLEWQNSNYKIFQKANTGSVCCEDGKIGHDLFLAIPHALDYIASYAKAHRDQRVRVIVTGSLYLAGGVFDSFIKDGYLPESILDL
eukprot:TRINITY_DN3778_c0_g1_i2.p1 TRINITY_DN3778_c0_g1~~TRINITY_DN3778_c0_g1_i2.p1  ORF type:complete len:134 (-),score=20.35 TRINITY_DN3778_c0_g1_i2:79-480(-)